MARILLVMDDPMLLKTTALTLEVIGGHKVVEASGVVEGAAHFSGGQSFDLVIVSCSNGDTLERQIADQHPMQRMMVCDGQGGDSHSSTTRYVARPQTAYDLLSPVQGILERT